MHRVRQFYVIEVLAAAVVGYAAYGVGYYQMMRIYFLWISNSKEEPVQHRLLIAIFIIVAMQWMVRLPLNLLRVLYRSGKITLEEFEPWRIFIENDILIVLATLGALPCALIIVFDSWRGEFLLFALPLLVLILIRKFLKLPDPTDRSNRLEVGGPIE